MKNNDKIYLVIEKSEPQAQERTKAFANCQAAESYVAENVEWAEFSENFTVHHHQTKSNASSTFLFRTEDDGTASLYGSFHIKPLEVEGQLI